jgi:hypothetical protein
MLRRSGCLENSGELRATRPYWGRTPQLHETIATNYQRFRTARAQIGHRSRAVRVFLRDPAASRQANPPRSEDVMMKSIALAAVIALSATAAEATPLTPAEQASLQSAMFQFIDRQLVKDKFLKLDLDTGEVRALFPAKAHPMILRMDDGFVLCTDFRDAKGQSVNVDFYVARNGEGFVIYDSEVDNRKPLMALMKSGKVSATE